MTDSVLDLIDHALVSYGDAMRWSPEPPEPSAPGVGLLPHGSDAVSTFDFAPFAALNIEITPWQEEILARLPTGSLTISFDNSSARFHHYTAPRSPGTRSVGGDLCLVPYEELGHLEREAIHAWIDLHGLDHEDVPIDGVLGFDETTGEYRIRVFRRRDGSLYLDENDEPASRVLRRVPRAPLPWRRVEET